MKSLKRTMAMCAAASLVFSAMTVMPASAASGTLTFKADSATYEPGDEITVTVVYDGSNLGGLEFLISENEKVGGSEYIEFVPSKSGMYPYVEIPSSITSIEDDADREDAESEYLADELAKLQASGKATVGYITGPSEETDLSKDGIKFIWQAGGTTNVKASGELLELTFKVKEGAPAGEYTIDAKSASFVRAKSGGGTDDVDITTTAAKFTVEDAEVKPTSLDVTPATIAFKTVGETALINVTVKPDDATNKDVTYKSNDTKVATVDKNGKVTAVAEGETTITVVAVGAESVTKTVKVTVAHTHKFKFVEEKAATCTEDGTKEYFECETCGKKYDYSDGANELTDADIKIAKLGHDFTKKDTSEKYLKSAATCSEPAVFYYSCSRCGEAGTETFTYGDLDPTNHGETKLVGAKEATYETEGYTGDEVCVDCGETVKYGKVIPVKEPELIPAKEPTCEEDGCIEHYERDDGTYWSKDDKTVQLAEKDVVIPATGHDYGEPTYEFSADNSECTAKRVCKNDASHVETETVKTVETVTKEPTYEEEGTATYTATFTNAAFKEQTKEDTLPVKVHTYEEVKAKEPTCEEDGNIAYYVRDDGKFFDGTAADAKELTEDDVKVAAIGHKWAFDESSINFNDDHTVAKAHATCENDPAHILDLETTDIEVVDSVDATCTTDGSVTYLVKFAEGFEGKVTETVAATGHDWGEWEVTKEATEEEEGEETRTCSICGETETRTIDKLAPEDGGDDNTGNEDGNGSSDSENNGDGDSQGSGDANANGGNTQGNNAGNNGGSQAGGDGAATGNPVTGAAAAMGVITVALGSLAIFKKRK